MKKGLAGARLSARGPLLRDREPDEVIAVTGQLPSPAGQPIRTSGGCKCPEVGCRSVYPGGPQIRVNPTLMTILGGSRKHCQLLCSLPPCVPNCSLPNGTLHPPFSPQACLHPAPQSLHSFPFSPVSPPFLPQGGYPCGLNTALLLGPLFKYPRGSSQGVSELPLTAENDLGMAGPAWRRGRVGEEPLPVLSRTPT